MVKHDVLLTTFSCSCTRPPGPFGRSSTFISSVSGAVDRTLCDATLV